eukprot:TRINITY_DN11287_c0_g1_i1.p2 TRINITY_DN11287_c0_g1~~TRINITY_DN11287_c0_g1_i1.p2  ORF type:complete len:145 (-),score=21.46 TRINITY_DN11287_c0_g1_i1:182-616(-)
MPPPVMPDFARHPELQLRLRRRLRLRLRLLLALRLRRRPRSSRGAWHLKHSVRRAKFIALHLSQIQSPGFCSMPPPPPPRGRERLRRLLDLSRRLPPPPPDSPFWILRKRETTTASAFRAFSMTFQPRSITALTSSGSEFFSFM